MPSCIKPKKYGVLAVVETGSITRLCRMVAAALAISGCSTPQPSTPPSQSSPPPVIAPADSATPALDITPPVDEQKPIAAVPEANNIFFPSGSTIVDDTGKDKLRQHAAFLKQNPKQLVTLVGYTDGQGSRNYNLAIAEERLMAVNKWLRTYGVSPRQIRRNRIGSVKNLPACSSMNCRQQMRRVELILSP